MKKRYYILVGIILILIAFYCVDRTIFMKKRVLRHNSWENTGGKRIRGDFIETKNVTFKGNTMIFDFETRGQKTVVEKSITVKWKGDNSDLEIINKLSKNEPFQDDRVSFRLDTSVYEYGGKGMDTLILKYQYFSTMKVMDPKTKEIGKYSMKGANWTDYLFNKKKKNK